MLGPLVTDKETEAQGDLFNSVQWRGSHGSIICSLTRVGNTDPPEIPLGGFLYNLNIQLGPEFISANGIQSTSVSVISDGIIPAPLVSCWPGNTWALRGPSPALMLRPCGGLRLSLNVPICYPRISQDHPDLPPGGPFSCHLSLPASSHPEAAPSSQIKSQFLPVTLLLGRKWPLRPALLQGWVRCQVGEGS